MPIAKHKLISDIEAQLHAGQPSDDSELDQKQIAHWVQIALHDLQRQEIVAEMKKGGGVPPIYVTRDTGLEMDEEAIADIDNNKQRFWITLTQDVLDLPYDRGIISVWDYDLNLLGKMCVGTIGMTRDLRFAAPSPDNRVWYRQGTKVFIEGINTDDIDFEPFMVDYVPKQDVVAMDDDDNILISDQLIPILMDTVIQRGKLELYGTQGDMASDGIDQKDTSYHLNIANPARQDQQNNQQQ